MSSEPTSPLAARASGGPQAGSGAAQRAEAATLQAQEQFQLGHFAEALAHSHRARADWAALGATERECAVLTTAALALSEVEAHGPALGLAQEALELATQRKLPGACSKAMATVGTLMGRLGDWDEAESMLLHALSLARDQSDAATVTGITNMMLALLSLALDDHSAAGRQREAELTRERLLHLARRARSQCGEMDQPFQRLVLASNIGGALLSCGEAHESRDWLQGVVQGCQQHGFRVAGLRAHIRLVRAHLALGDRAGAESQLDTVQQQLASEEHPQAQAEVLALQSALALAAGDPQRAQALDSRLAALQERRRAHNAALRNSVVTQEALRRAWAPPAGP